MSATRSWSAVVLVAALTVALLIGTPQHAVAAEGKGPCLGCSDDIVPPTKDAGADGGEI